MTPFAPNTDAGTDGAVMLNVVPSSEYVKFTFVPSYAARSQSALPVGVSFPVFGYWPP